MSEIERQLREDRALRNAAYALVKADIDNLKNEYSRKGIASRTADRIREGATDVYEEAVEVANDHRGTLAALLAALGLWVVRHPVLSFLFGEEGTSDESDDQDDRITDEHNPAD